MKIAFYKAKYGNWLDKLISVLTLSKYSHCEIILDSNIFVSASPRDGGVRFKNITADNHWDCFDIYDVNTISNEAQEWFESVLGQKYDWLGAAGSLFGLNFTSKNKKFCSYCCATVLDLDPITTPGELYETLLEIRMIRAITIK